MNQEPAIDLRALDTGDAQFVHEAARRFRRRMVIRAAWVLVFAVAIGAATFNLLNSRSEDVDYLAEQVAGKGVETDGAYVVDGAEIGLLKVAALPSDRWGLDLVVHWDSPEGGVGVFALTSGARSTVHSGWPVAGRWAQTIVDVPMSVGRQFDLRLIDPKNQVLGTFTVDLDALGVPEAGEE